VTSDWHWRADRTDRSGRGGGQGAPVGTERFPTQGEAESWLGETYPDLLVSGVRSVTLYEGDRLVYGPMSLEADAG